jgi:hypothetical protein
MRKLLIALIVVFTLSLVSCYENNATFTVQVSGYAPTYMIGYKAQNGEWMDSLVVPRGYEFYNEYSDSWQLDLKVKAEDSIFVYVLKRGNLKETLRGKDSLEVHKTIPF